MELQLFEIIVLVMAAVAHEYMHGWMADILGDPTARHAGRLTLNPLKHIDPFGSILLPLLLIFSGTGFVFGYAKPVPYNPYNLRDQKYGGAKVALAGPMANFLMAIVFGLVLRFIPFGSTNIQLLLMIIVQINLVLGVFNLVPIPPMDGSKVIAPFLPIKWQLKLDEMEKYGMFLILLFVMFGFSLILPVINFLFKLIVGPIAF